MRLLPFQRRTAVSVLARLRALKKRGAPPVVAIADETGLGKTHVVAEVLARLCEQHPRSALRVFYFASNLTLARTNATLLTDILDQRLGSARRWPSIDGNDTHADRILRLGTRGIYKKGVVIAGLTPTTSLTFSSTGTKRENLLAEEFKRNRLGRSKKKRKEWPKARIKRTLAREVILNRLRPSVIIFDEYQSFVRALDSDSDVTGSQSGLAPFLIRDYGKAHCLLVSATPFDLTLPDTEDELSTDARRTPLSFEVFSKVLSGYNPDRTEEFCDGQAEYAAAWLSLLTELNRKRDFSRLAKETKVRLSKARTKFSSLMRPQAVRTYRDEQADPHIREAGPNAASARDYFLKLAKTHAAAKDIPGWAENWRIFASAARFYRHSEKGAKGAYKMGRRIGGGNRAVRELAAQLDREAGGLVESSLKRQWLQDELHGVGLARSELRHPLWIRPCGRKPSRGASDKMLIFSSYRATPLEICGYLKDPELPIAFLQGAPGKRKKQWYLSSQNEIKASTLFWLRPSAVLKSLGASRSILTEGDEASAEQIRRALKNEGGKKWKAWEKFSASRPLTRASRTPGVDIISALFDVLASHGVSRAAQRELLGSNQRDVHRALVLLKQAAEHYVGNSTSLHSMWCDFGKDIPRRIELKDKLATIAAYCRRHGWRAVWVEYFDQLLASKLQTTRYREGDGLASTVCAAIHESATVLRMRPTLRRGRKTKRGDEVLPGFTSHTAARFGRAEHSPGKMGKKSERRPDDILKAFNSPFGPFVLCTTSVGEEGLNFHRYCGSQIHWDPPSTGMALAQRIGRIVRFRGLRQRRQVAGYSRSRGFMWHEATKKIKSEKLGLIPDFQSRQAQSGTPSSLPRIQIFAPRYTGQHARALRAKRHYMDLKYFVGMSPDQLKSAMALLDFDLSTKARAALARARYTVDLRPIGGIKLRS